MNITKKFMDSAPEYSASDGFKSFVNTLPLLSTDEQTALISDCKTCFTCRELGEGDKYSIGSTFFIHADCKPRCGLEELALQIFNFHTKGIHFDPSRSGAEWWTQYIDHRDDIGFHWDRDYGLEEDGTNMHPLFGTVTYLSPSSRAPTVIFDKKGTFSKESDACGALRSCIVSYPIIGKHIRFNGELLHGAPSSLAYPTIDEDVEDVRVTFLVNLWIDHVPTQSQRLGEETAQSLVLPTSLFAQKPLFLNDEQTVEVFDTQLSDGDLELYKWGIGGTSLIIEAKLPYPALLKGLTDVSMIDFIKIENSRIYVGELSDSSSSSNESDTEEGDESGSDRNSSFERPTNRKRTRDGHLDSCGTDRGSFKRPF